MKRLIILLVLLSCLVPAARAASPADEYILLIGGPSLMQWEKYKKQPHDHWWANFVRAGRIRTEQLRAASPEAKITWLVYKQGYVDRGAQEHQDLLTFIDSVREKYDLNLVYFRDGAEVINYLNNGQPRDKVKIAGLEYFGHSNKACFMFDYSSNVDSASKSWLRESEVGAIHRNVFARNAMIRSWGCYTGESMSKKWRSALGFRMVGAIGKTQYMMNELPILATPGGKWTN